MGCRFDTNSPTRPVRFANIRPRSKHQYHYWTKVQDPALDEVSQLTFTPHRSSLSLRSADPKTKKSPGHRARVPMVTVGVAISPAGFHPAPVDTSPRQLRSLPALSRRTGVHPPRGLGEHVETIDHRCHRPLRRFAPLSGDCGTALAEVATTSPWEVRLGKPPCVWCRGAAARQRSWCRSGGCRRGSYVGILLVLV
jgi:hypothetical protein